MTERKIVSAKQAVSYRNYRRARDRALAKLAQIYPETYQDLLQREKESDEQLGKKWFATDAVTSVTFVDIRTATTPARPSGNHHAKNEGDNGGEA